MNKNMVYKSFFAVKELFLIMLSISIVTLLDYSNYINLYTNQSDSYSWWKITCSILIGYIFIKLIVKQLTENLTMQSLFQK